MSEFNPDKPFGGVLGSTAELKVLDLLLSVPRHGYNISELARAANLARATCDRVVKHLVGWQILRILEGHGNVDSFWINEESSHISALRDFHFTTLYGDQGTRSEPSQVARTTYRVSFSSHDSSATSMSSFALVGVSVGASATVTTNASTFLPTSRTRAGEAARFLTQPEGAIAAA